MRHRDLYLIQTVYSRGAYKTASVTLLKRSRNVTNTTRNTTAHLKTRTKQVNSTFLLFNQAILVRNVDTYTRLNSAAKSAYW